MKVGTVTEIKNHEYRVGMTPNCARAYAEAGHEVLVQKGAGLGAGYEDAEYEAAGARLVETAAQVWGAADMIVKVKEPLKSEYRFFRHGLILYTFLHLAADRDLTDALLASGVKAVAYETITEGGVLPCLRPMSEIAGRLAAQEGAKYLERPFGGRGVLLGGVPGVEKGRVLIVGAGVVGRNACKVALGMGAKVTVMDTNINKLIYIDDVMGGAVRTLFSNAANFKAALAEADLVIGAVLIPGATAPRIIQREHLKLMKKGAVIVDVAVDQGGCCETTHATTHENPVYEVDGVVHYCVANMPGAVPRTSTQALTNATLSYGLMIANLGMEGAIRRSDAIVAGVNTYEGKCTCPGVADAFGMVYHRISI